MSVYSVGYTEYNTGTRAQPMQWGSRIVAYCDTYEAVALADGSTVYMFRPDKGMKYAGIGQLAWDDLGTGATIAVGIVGATDKFLAATDVCSAADKADLDAGATAISAIGYEFDGATDVILTTASAATTGTITLLMLFYKV
jgi:hypothetical protein